MIKPAFFPWIARACGMLALASAASAFAQSANYPSRFIKVIVPSAPGGPADIMMRTITPKLNQLLGRPANAPPPPPAEGGGAELHLPMVVRALYGAGLIRDAAEKIDHALAPSTPVPDRWKCI